MYLRILGCEIEGGFERMTYNWTFNIKSFCVNKNKPNCFTLTTYSFTKQKKLYHTRHFSIGIVFLPHLPRKNTPVFIKHIIPDKKLGWMTFL